MTELTLKVGDEEFEIDSVTLESINEHEYTKCDILGYSPGDVVEIGGKIHTIDSVSWSDFPDEPKEMSIQTVSGLSIGGEVEDVLKIITNE